MPTCPSKLLIVTAKRGKNVVVNCSPRIIISAATISLIASVLVGSTNIQASKTTTPSAPVITRVDSIKRTATNYNLQVYFSIKKSTSTASVTSTLVSASGKTCSATAGKQSCTIQNITKNIMVNITAKSKNANGYGSLSSTVQYKVGSGSWTINAGTSTSSPINTSNRSAVDERPYSQFVPSSYSAKSPAPLVVLLHGYGSSGKQQESYMNFTAVAEQRGFILAYPDGTGDLTGRQFWNATDACCAFSSSVDDDAYLIAMLDDIEAKYSINRKRIYFVGHSNGGFMSYHMACKHSDRIAAIASLAGATFFNSTDCAANNPVSVLQVHGTNDATILYNGGSILGNQYPSALASVSQWVTVNKCSTNSVPHAEKIDLERSIAGDETSIASWTKCRNGTEVELWTMENAGHIPALTSSFASKIYDFFSAHPKE